MRLLKAISLLAMAIAAVRASGGEADNEITFYGCPEECSAQEGPSCPQFDDDNLPTDFAALSTKLPHYDDYCGHYAVYLRVDGGSVKLGRATVVDSCSSCSKYHLDLSKKAFTKLTDEHKGTSKVIWGIYSKKGEKLAGPFYNSVSSAAEKFKMSSDSFIASFNANAKKLASSGSSTLTFSKDGVSSSDYVEKVRDDDDDRHSRKTTTTRKTTTRRTTSVVSRPTYAAPKNVNNNRPINNNNNQIIRPKPFPVVTSKQAPVAKQIGTTVAAPKVPLQTVAPKVPAPAPAPAPSSVPAPAPAPAPTQAPAEKKIEIVGEDKKENDDSVGATTLLAIGGGVVGAAGVGLLLMKKKSPSTYEDMKQKFPEAFTTVKRGLSRSATSIKRRVTKREAAGQPVVMSQQAVMV